MSKIFHTKFFDNASFCAFMNLVIYLEEWECVKFERSSLEMVAEYLEYPDYDYYTDETLKEMAKDNLVCEDNGSQILTFFGVNYCVLGEGEYSLEEDLSENVGYRSTFFYEVLRLLKRSNMNESDADKLLDRVMYALDLDDEDVEEYYEMVDDEIAMLKQIDKLTKAHQKKVKHMFDFDDDTAEKRLKF